MTRRVPLPSHISIRSFLASISVVVSKNNPVPDMPKGVLFLLLLTVVMATVVTADCGCGTKCFAYSDPSRCTRCCTATVKRSLRTGPDGKPLRGLRFLTSSGADDYKRPMWLRPTNDRMLQKLGEILRFMDPPLL